MNDHATPDQYTLRSGDLYWSHLYTSGDPDDDGPNRCYVECVGDPSRATKWATAAEAVAEAVEHGATRTEVVRLRGGRAEAVGTVAELAELAEAEEWA